MDNHRWEGWEIVWSCLFSLAMKMMIIIMDVRWMMLLLLIKGESGEGGDDGRMEHDYCCCLRNVCWMKGGQVIRIFMIHVMKDSILSIEYDMNGNEWFDMAIEDDMTE